MCNPSQMENPWKTTQLSLVEYTNLIGLDIHIPTLQNEIHVVIPGIEVLVPLPTGHLTPRKGPAVAMYCFVVSHQMSVGFSLVDLHQTLFGAYVVPAISMIFWVDTNSGFHRFSLVLELVIPKFHLPDLLSHQTREVNCVEAKGCIPRSSHGWWSYCVRNHQNELS